MPCRQCYTRTPGDRGPSRPVVLWRRTWCGAPPPWRRTLLEYFGSDATLVSHPLPGIVALLAYHNQAMYGMLVLTVQGDRIAGIEAAVDMRI